MTEELERAFRTILRVIVNKVERDFVSRRNTAVTLDFYQEGSKFVRGNVFKKEAILATLQEVSTRFGVPETEISIGSANSLPPKELIKRLWVYNQPLFEKVVEKINDE